MKRKGKSVELTNKEYRQLLYNARKENIELHKENGTLKSQLIEASTDCDTALRIINELKKK